MGILALNADERVRDVRVSEDTLTVDLMDGRTISVPLVWYPRLLGGTPKQRSNWKVCAAGYGIHWPELNACYRATFVIDGRGVIRFVERYGRGELPDPAKVLAEVKKLG